MLKWRSQQKSKQLHKFSTETSQSLKRLLWRGGTVAFAAEHRDEDAAVVLLRDIRDIFDGRRVNRLPSKMIVDHLNSVDDAMWSEWRGIGGHQLPRKLSQGELARLLQGRNDL